LWRSFVLGVGVLLLPVVAMAQQPGSDQSATGAAAPRVVELPLGSGGSQRVLYAAASPAHGTIVMLPGGAGEVDIDAQGDFLHGKNFVVRTRNLWNANGYAVIIPDAFKNANMRGIRSSPQYAEVVSELVGYAHKQAPGPVFLLGTSQGSIAAMNGASHLLQGQIAGVVLTESVSRQGGSHETVFDAHPELVNVPALVVANRDDACRVAPPDDAAKIAAAMTHSPQVKVIYVSGGVLRSTDCGSLSPHGYYGIEQSVVDAIVAWMKAQT
jgi:pimeloyl-ACP methyl ester carboxylesterase